MQLIIKIPLSTAVQLHTQQEITANSVWWPNGKGTYHITTIFMLPFLTGAPSPPALITHLSKVVNY